MTTTNQHAITELEAQQANAHATVNAALQLIDRHLHLTVLGFDGDGSPPGSPATGDAWILGASGSGAWAGYTAQNIAWYDGSAWVEIASKEGMQIWDASSKTEYIFNGTYWWAVIASDSITAYSGGGQANATQLARGISRVTTVGAPADSVKLPAAEGGVVLWVINVGANSMDVFPASGDSINALSVNTEYPMEANAARQFVCVNATNWYTVG